MSIVAIDCRHCAGESHVCQASAYATQLIVTRTSDPDILAGELSRKGFAPEVISAVLVGKGLRPA